MNGILGFFAGTVLCFTMATYSMTIDNHCSEEEKESIRNVSGEFEDDYLFMGNELNFSGTTEDLVFLGKTLTFKGRTELGLMAVGKKVLYSGESGNGITAAGMNVVIDGTVKGNNYIGCKSFQLTDKAAVEGDLFVGCARGTIDGVLNGDLYAAAGELVINSPVNGNVTAYGGRIRIGAKGKINGNLTYAAKEKLTIEEAARVSGTVKRDEQHDFDMEKMFPKKAKKWVSALFAAGMALSFMIIGSLLLFLPVFRKLDAPQQERAFWYTSLRGLIPLLMYPAVLLLCFVLVVTIPFAVVLMFAFVPLFFTAWLIGTTLAGKYITTKLKWNVRRRHFQFLIGAGAGAILSLIPFVNFIAGVFLCALGWGMFVKFLFNAPEPGEPAGISSVTARQ